MGGGIGGGIGLGGSSEPVTWAKPTARTSSSFSNIDVSPKESSNQKRAATQPGTARDIVMYGSRRYLICASIMPSWPWREPESSLCESTESRLCFGFVLRGRGLVMAFRKGPLTSSSSRTHTQLTGAVTRGATPRLSQESTGTPLRVLRPRSVAASGVTLSVTKIY